MMLLMLMMMAKVRTKINNKLLLFHLKEHLSSESAWMSLCILQSIAYSISKVQSINKVYFEMEHPAQVKYKFRGSLLLSSK